MAVLFESRQSLELCSPLLVNHFRKFGMEIHVGDRKQKDKPSKTEVLFVASSPRAYENPETYDGADLSDIELGDDKYFPVVDKFCYLGTFLTRLCTDKEDVCNRKRRAGGAFGTLRKLLFSSSSVSYVAKGKAYKSLILPILLYGSESWCLTEALYGHLRVFHHNCLRAMCRLNRSQTFVYGISNAVLRERLGLQPIKFYVSK